MSLFLNPEGSSGKNNVESVDSYTKSESDAKYATTAQLAGKANTGVSYTKAESDGKYATTATLNTELAKKANTGVSYTKAESDGKYATTTTVNGKANVGTSYTKAESDAKYQVIKTRNIATASIASDYTLTLTDDYETLPLTDILQVGTAFSTTADGGIKLSKAGVVSVSMKVYFGTASANAKLAVVYLDDLKVNQSNFMGNSRGTIVGTPTLVNVAEGQTLYLKAYGETGDLIAQGKYQTNVTVEYID